MKTLSLLLIIQLQILFNVYGVNPVNISGNAIDYAGNKIDIYYEHDFVSKDKIIMGTINIAKDGSFNTQFEITHTVLGQADFDSYHAMVYLEPGKNYQLVFPAKKKLTEAQKRNPFFEPSQVWFGLSVADNDDLNVLIQNYEGFYYQLENTYFRQIFVNRSYSTAKTFKLRLDDKFPQTDNPVFEAHKKYRQGNIDFALNQGKSTDFLSEYFTTEDPLYHLPAYTNLFLQVFTDYFIHLGSSADKQEIKSAIRQGNLKSIEKVFTEQLNFPQKLSRLIIISSLKDAYYSVQFNQAEILNMIQIIVKSDWNDYEKSIAEKVYNKLTFLLPGTLPPKISLVDLDGKSVELSDYRNQLIYLHFTDAKNPVCRQHLDALEPIADKYINELVIIHVLTNNNSAKDYYPWPGIYTKTNDRIEERYKVKTYPTSYLIGRDGKLLWSPAPNPIDGLNSRLSQWFRKERIQQLKNQ